jgi:transposase
MAQYLSEDLRVRVIDAVDAGSTRRQAAARFGVSVASAVRWVQEWRETGRTAPKPRGGDRKSSRIEAHGDFLLGRIKDVPDITLEELREQLRGERGLEVSISALWRFFDRHQVTFKKRRRTRANKIVPM